MKERVRNVRHRTKSTRKLNGSVETLRLDPLAKEVLNNVYGILKRRGRTVENDAF